jgi:hypothetical protein
MKLGDQKAGHRGFPTVEFRDCYQSPCSLQCSSIILSDEGAHNPGTSAVWLGVTDADPKVLAREAHLVLVKTEETTGWVPYPIPENVSLTTRMHLNREQVAGLIQHLQT